MTHLLRITQVTKLVGIAPSTIWKYVKLNKFPKPHKLSPRVTVWKSSDIEAYIDEVTNV